MLKKENRFIFFAAFLLLGVVLAIQFRSTLYLNRQKSSQAYDADRLIAGINEEINRQNELKAELEDSMAKNEQYINAFFENKDSSEMKRQYDDARLKAGLTDVQGPGIIITLDDAEARQGEDPELLIIHDQDIRIILNDLKKAGAQAISINGERIVAMSEQVCAGPIILINRNRYAVPFIINVIGDPDVLYGAVTDSERIALMIEDKIRVEVKKAQDIVVPRFSNSDNIDNLTSGLEVVNK